MGRASGNEKIDRDNVVRHVQYFWVILIRAAGDGACPYRDHDLRSGTAAYVF